MSEEVWVVEVYGQRVPGWAYWNSHGTLEGAEETRSTILGCPVQIEPERIRIRRYVPAEDNND